MPIVLLLCPRQLIVINSATFYFISALSFILSNSKHTCLSNIILNINYVYHNFCKPVMVLVTFLHCNY
jgi:hypothetical protein